MASQHLLSLYDTMTSSSRPLVPERDNEVRIYTCGPTPYDVAHVGHARAALAPDLLARYLRSKGFKVTAVRNITDVEDKILERSAKNGEEPTALAARMVALYQADMRAIGCSSPDVEPKVSEHIPEIVAIIERLIANGAAYVADMPGGTKDVYFAVRSFAGYGKLSKRNLDDLRAGARIEVSEHKRDPMDFALWKGCTQDAWGWDSPWGKGRPGWHIECSAMSSKHLGHGFEVHTGGMDLIFPHHENEIAQSEAAFPDKGPLASIWIHNGFVTMDKEKMSKSLGNFVTIAQVLERNDAEALRYFLLTVHYRGPINLDTEVRCKACDAVKESRAASEVCASCGKAGEGRVVFPGVIEAERRVDYLYTAMNRLEAVAATEEPNATQPITVPKDFLPYTKLVADARARVDAALADDLNTPAVLVVLAELAKAANELCDLVAKRRKDTQIQRASSGMAKSLHAALDAAITPLGLLQAPFEEYRRRTQAQRLAILGVSAAQIDERLKERAAAREAKDFARSDAIRKELEAKSIEVADTPSGTVWRVGI